MCGIAGIIGLSRDKQLIAPNIHRMTMQMKHRGPDDEGYLLVDTGKREIEHYYGDDTPRGENGCGSLVRPHIKEAYSRRTNIAFGHRRLNIIDLTFGGHQPMTTADGGLTIIFNGEIYNYKAVQFALEREGHRFQTGCDTEVVLMAYKQWGSHCLQMFNGMFAFAVYDRFRQEVFIARDRIGIKPLYYTFQKDFIIFGSDIKTIIASGLYKPQVNWEGLWHNFSFSVSPRPMTAFKDVNALQPGHWMKIDLSNFKITRERYWNILTYSQDLKMTESDAVELLEEQLTRAIRYRLTADVEVGTFMSGGIDSTTISAIASRLHPGISSFTLAFKEPVPEYQELEQAKATARRHPLKHIIEIADPDLLLDHVGDMVLGYEEPICILSPNYILAQCIARHGITVVLNGLGGDELFAGYSHYRDVKYWRLKRFLANFTPQPWRRYRKMKNIDNFYVDQYAMITENDKRNLFTGKQYDTTTILEKMYTTDSTLFTDDIEALSYLDIMNYIGNHHVYRIDQFTMRFSLEGRFPFLDHELIELAFRIPSRHKINKSCQKCVLRKVAEKYIAPECLTMPKKGFGIPVGRWMKNQLKHLTETTLEQLKDRDIFNNRYIDFLYEDFKQKSPVHYKKVWHLVMTELWFQYFIDGKKAPVFNLNNIKQ